MSYEQIKNKIIVNICYYNVIVYYKDLKSKIMYYEQIKNKIIVTNFIILNEDWYICIGSVIIIMIGK